MLPVMILIEVVIAIDLIEELKAVPRDNFQVIGDIGAIVLLGFIIVYTINIVLNLAILEQIKILLIIAILMFGNLFICWMWTEEWSNFSSNWFLLLWFGGISLFILAICNYILINLVSDLVKPLLVATYLSVHKLLKR